jgi:hypothetical protein
VAKLEFFDRTPDGSVALFGAAGGGYGYSYRYLEKSSVLVPMVYSCIDLQS